MIISNVGSRSAQSIYNADRLRMSKCRLPSKLPMRQKPSAPKAKPHCQTQVSLRPKSARDDGPGKQNNSRSIGRLDKHRIPTKEPIKMREDNIAFDNRQEYGSMHSTNYKVINDCGDDKQLKVNLQNYTKNFESMKKDLDERQKAILELYLKIINSHKRLIDMGQVVPLAMTEELNIVKFNSEQLLQLCSIQSSKTNKDQKQVAKLPPPIDSSKIKELPNKLIAACEQTLQKRQEIIDWVTCITSNQKGIPRQTLENKIQEFDAENEMLKNSIGVAKADFMRKMYEVLELVQKTTEELIARQLQIEEQMCELSEMKSENANLVKQLHNAEKQDIQKFKLQELETQLKEVKLTKANLREQLSRANGQVEIGEERAGQLESALGQAKFQISDLERTVQQLQKQNQQAQANWDKELNKVTESVRVNMKHLEEISSARFKLQAEKEELEKRLEDLSEYYNESLKSVKHDMNMNIAKLIETEKKFNDEVEEKKKLATKMESLQAQTVECEMRNKNLEIMLREKETQIGKLGKCDKELQSTLQKLNEANTDLEDCRERITEQSKAIKLLESNLEESMRLEEKTKSNLLEKDAYICQLEKKQAQHDEQLQDSEMKMSSYEMQLKSLKDHITQLQEDFGEFHDLEDLHEMVNKQRANLLETTRQNGELAQALQKKDEELEGHIERLADQEQIIEQKDDFIKLLTEKEEEQTNIIKLLRTNLEMRTQADMDLSRQISEKNSEIEALIVNVETRKQQIAQLEAIILSLEEQTQKSIVQRRKKDQDKIYLLEKQLAEYEMAQLEYKREIPAKNLDSIIKLLEEELGTPFEPQKNSKSREYITMPNKTFVGDPKLDVRHFEYHNKNNLITYQTEHRNGGLNNSKASDKGWSELLDDLVQKTCAPNDAQSKIDSLDRKKAITHMDTQKWANAPKPGTDLYDASPPDTAYFRRAVFTATHPFFTRNQSVLKPDQFKDEKKRKMLKLACHKL